MLDFGMETRRINQIIEVGARSKLSDLEFLELEVTKFLRSPQRRMMVDGENYYNFDHEIGMKRRMVLTDNGTEEDHNLPNNRLVDNQYSTMVDQKVNYILSKPITFKTENKAYARALADVFNKAFNRLIKDIGRDAYNGAVGWLYPYYNERGEFVFRRFHPWESLPFWKDDDHTELDFFTRVYEVLAYEGKEEKKLQFVDVYDTKGIHHFTRDANGKLLPDYSINYFELKSGNNEDDIEAYNWDRVPVIPFKSSGAEMPLIRKAKCLQDAINQVLSDFADGMQENASGNSILVIHNYGGTNLGEFRRNLIQYRAVKVESVDGTDGGIDTLKIEVNSDNYKLILDELRKALIRNCRGYDIEELKSSGSPNEMTIKSIFAAIDMDANELETEFQASFEQLLWFVNAHLLNAHVGDFSNEEVDVIFNRDLMINESQVITDCQNSAGILSQKTIIANHPWTTDPELEWQQVQDEQNQKLADTDYSFGSPMNDNKDNEDTEGGDEEDGEGNS